MFFLAYLPFLGLCTLVGVYYYTPIAVTFIQNYTRTLDVPKSLALDGFVEYFERAEELSALPSTLAISSPPSLHYSEDIILPHVLIAVAMTFLVVLELASAIRQNITDARQASSSDSLQIFFNSDPLAILETFPTKPLDLEIAQASSVDEYKMTAEDSEGTDMTEDSPFAPRAILVPSADRPKTPITPLRKTFDLSQLIQDEIHHFTPLKRSGPRLSRARELSPDRSASFEEWNSRFTGDMSLSLPEKPELNRYFTPLISSEESPSCTPPGIFKDYVDTCPLWSQKAPHTSALHRLYSLSPTTNHLQPTSFPQGGLRIVHQNYASVSGVPTATIETTISPQNWRLRQARPTISEGGIRMISHWLGKTAKHDHKEDFSRTSDCSLHVDGVVDTCGEVSPANHETDRTLVERASICVKKEDSLTVKTGYTEEITPPPSPATSVIWKGTRRFQSRDMNAEDDYCASSLSQG